MDMVVLEFRSYHTTLAQIYKYLAMPKEVMPQGTGIKNMCDATMGVEECD